MTQVQQPEALIFANDRPTSIDDDLYQWSIDAEDLIRRQHALISRLESEAQANAHIIGASAENELALRARVQELQRRVAKLENELSARATGSLKPVA